MSDNESSAIERAKLGFREEALHVFSFLEAIGFIQVESSSTLVGYQHDDICANIYHGRQSYEVEFEIVYAGTRYSLSELIRLADPSEGDAYRNTTAKTPAGVHDGLNRVQELVERYAVTALQGDPATFVSLNIQRREWAKALGLKTQTAALKRKAEEAFRLGHYTDAAQIYEQIKAALSPTEMRKADLARKHAVNVK